MSIIAVKGVPSHWSIKATKYAITKTKIKSGFEVLNFDKSRGNIKTVYIRVSEKWDPLQMIEKINRLTPKNAKFTAFMPNHIPDLPLAGKKTPQRNVRPTGQTYEWKLVTTHKELMEELQCKYTRLLELSKKTGHKLLDEIAETLFRRLKLVMQSNCEATENCFTLSKGYRKAHPHFADFQLILSTLHRLEDATGAPRTQLSETDLMGVELTNYETEYLPEKQVKKISAKYESRIVNKVLEYVESLPAAPAPAQPEEAARARVRTELKNIAPYLGQIIQQVISSSCVPNANTNHRMRMYGEPFLPPKDVLVPTVLKRCRASALVRSQRLFNMLRFNVPLDQFAAAMSLDGTVMGAAKLVVRPSPNAEYKIKKELIAEMNAAFAMDAQ